MLGRMVTGVSLDPGVCVKPIYVRRVAEIVTVPSSSAKHQKRK